MRPAGSGLVEALVALALVGLGAGALAAVAATSGRTLARVREDAAAVALAAGGLEALRAGPRTDGADAPAPFARDWRVVAGRGRPDRCEVRVAGPGGAFTLAGAVAP